MEKIQVTIAALDRTFLFVGGVHKSENPAALQLEHSFYEKWSLSQALPEFPHYEIELLVRPEEIIGQPKFHQHINPHTNKVFMCWTGPNPSTSQSECLFRFWCAGTVFTILTGLTFDQIFVQAGEDPEKTTQCFEEVHGIKVSSVEWL
jgi:hypothetical protein